jgi:hypothetical protein
MSAQDAHKELDKIWSRRHKLNPRDTETKNKHMLPHDMPGTKHSDKSVRERAWKMQAQAQANTLGDSYTKRGSRGRTTPKVRVRVVQNRKTGARNTTTSWAHKPGERVPAGHDVVHSVMSEGLKRSPLLLELVANTFLSKFPPGSSVYGVPGSAPTHKRAQTTAKLGMVTQQGGVFTGKKHQKLHDKKIKTKEKCYKQAGRDRISQELCDSQPVVTGGVTTGLSMLKRTRLGG